MHQNANPQDLIVRRLHTSDQVDVCDHFLRLDVHSRRARFCGVISDDGVLKYAQNIFSYDSVVCGAFVDGRLRGVVELGGLFQSWPSSTEAAFSVELQWENIGIGDALFERMCTMAHNRGVRTIQMMCLKENKRMRQLATKHDAVLFADQDAVEAVLHPFWPTWASISKEMSGVTKGYSHLLFK